MGLRSGLNPEDKRHAPRIRVSSGRQDEMQLASSFTHASTCGGKQLMSNIHIVILSILVALSISIVSEAQAKDIDERKWILMETANFSIHSSLSEKKTRDILLHLEALRGVFASGMDSTSKLEEKPTNILVVGKSSDYKKLGLPENSAGWFMRDLRNNFIIISNSSRMSESQVILHEYIHFIMHATQRFPYPKWWNEGYAEYVSSSTLSKTRFEFGLPLDGRLNDLANSSWLPWEDIITATSLSGLTKRKRAMYYAQSWFLVHFLHNRKDKPLSVHESWTNYLRHLRNGDSVLSAFEQAFNTPIDELKSGLQRYSRGGTYQYWRVPVESVVPEFEPAVKRVSRHDMQIQLGQFTLLRRDAALAKEWFEAALALDSESAVARSGLGSATAMSDDLDAAEQHFDAALENAPDDPVILIEHAKFEMHRASSGDAWFTRGDHLEKAEKLLTKARSISGGTVEIDTYLAYLWLETDDDPWPALRLLESVVVRSPSDQWPLLLLAEGFSRVGEADAAVDLAQSVIRYDHGESSYSTKAQRLIDRIHDTDQERSAARPKIAAPALPATD